MKRLPHWEARLGALLDGARKRPFSFGEWDCALFGAAVIEALTGEDHGAPFRGRYRTVRGYRRALAAEGHADLFGPFDALAPRRAPLLCQRGDIVTDGVSIGCLWSGQALFVGGEAADAGQYEVGLVTMPLAGMLWGWGIGHG